MGRKQKDLIGIIGGMGPMASVLLQKIMIDLTPAARDQDHLPVICFSNPQIPDRTISLAKNNGMTFVAAVRDTARVLVQAGATVLVLPCNTAHSRLEEIQQEISVPIVNMVSVTVFGIIKKYPAVRTVGLLATDGTLHERVYERAASACNLSTIIPNKREQKQIMRIIYSIKARGVTPICIRDLKRVINGLIKRGAEAIILGCTELSLAYNELPMDQIPIVDSLREVSHSLINLYFKK